MYYPLRKTAARQKAVERQNRTSTSITSATLTTERPKRKLESGTSSQETVISTDDVKAVPKKRAHIDLSQVSDLSAEKSQYYLQLYFKCRCDDKVAFKQLEEEAETNAVAKAFLCDVLVHNEVFSDVKKDVKRAQHLSKDVHYWIAASDTKNNPTTHATKMYISGVCLAQGIGIPKNQARAAQCIEEAAELGNCLAQYFVGAWYRDGRGVTQNMETAVKYFKLAAAQGHPIAQNMLGLCYATGQGVDTDHRLAEEHYRMSAEQGLQIAKTNLESVVKRRPP